MDELRSEIIGSASLVLAWGGFALGCLFGFVLQQTNFCAMGAISDIVSFADSRRFRAWILAGAVALAGAQALSHFAWVDLSLSIYLAPSFNWSGNLIGGLLLGVGMVFAGGCTSKNLVRFGGGDLRAALVLMVVGITAYMTLGGVFAPARAWLEATTAIALPTTQSAAALLAHFGAGDEDELNIALGGLLAVGMVVYCFADREFRGSPRNVLGGVGVGLCVIAGWALTGLAYDEFVDKPLRPLSLSFVRPTGDTLEYLQRFTAGMTPSFGVASIFGALAGACVGALASGKFKLIGFADSHDTLRNLAGAILMGVGGVTALGCTIGQGVTGVSTLAIGSLLTFLAIAAGAVIGMKWMERLVV